MEDFLRLGTWELWEALEDFAQYVGKVTFEHDIEPHWMELIEEN